jgi:hypothetical protein
MELLDKHHAVLEPALRQVGARSLGFCGCGSKRSARHCVPLALCALWSPKRPRLRPEPPPSYRPW